ncbi:MAG TPA: response regulator [Candidatus Acidoferrum sp.]|nr:response regulator [Candidatus Acidoferrum sp.]
MSDAGNFSQHESQQSRESHGAVNPSQPQQSQESSLEFEYCLDDILASENFEPDPCAQHSVATPGGYGEASAIGAAAANAANSMHSAGAPSASQCTCGDACRCAGDSPAAPGRSLQETTDALRNDPRADRRKRRRALISATVRVRGINLTDAVVDEISTTIDVSRAGILFLSSSPNYARGMEVAVIFPYSTAPAVLHAEQPGRVVRSFETPGGRYAVAIALGEGVGEDIVDACGRKLADSSGTLRPSEQPAVAPPAVQLNPAPPRAGSSVNTFTREPNSRRPLVLVVEADDCSRITLKGYLQSEGYDVMAVSNCSDAREVLSLFTPSLVLAEVEGEGLPGYDLCAHVKQSPRLKHIPVVLTTSSGYPSDYSNAHSLGAVVCMTKPYKQERLGHVVRLLVPPSKEFCAKAGAGAPRPADPSRRCGYGNGSSAATQKQPFSALKIFKFPSFR